MDDQVVKYQYIITSPATAEPMILEGTDPKELRKRARRVIRGQGFSIKAGQVTVEDNITYVDLTEAPPREVKAATEDDEAEVEETTDGEAEDEVEDEADDDEDDGF